MVFLKPFRVSASLSLLLHLPLSVSIRTCSFLFSFTVSFLLGGNAKEERAIRGMRHEGGREGSRRSAHPAVSPAAARGASAARGRGSALPLGQAPAGLLSAGASSVCAAWTRRRRKSSQDLSPLCVKRCCCVGCEFVMRRQGGDSKRPRKTLNRHKSLRECLSKCLFLTRYSWRVDRTPRTGGR